MSRFLTKELLTDSPVLYIFVAGFRSDDKEQRQFEWENMTKNMDISKVYIVNRTGRWYHDCLDEAIAYLEPLMQGKETTFVGVSMGGYAALLLAHIFGTDSISICPQSSLEMAFKEKHDRRWMGSIGDLNETTPHQKYLDISFIEGKHHHVYYASDCPEDKAQAERLNVCLHPLPFNSHSTAQWMKKQGILKTVLERKCYAGNCSN